MLFAKLRQEIYSFTHLGPKTNQRDRGAQERKHYNMEDFSESQSQHCWNDQIRQRIPSANIRSRKQDFNQ